MIKRIFSLFLILSISMLLFACKSDEETTKSNTTTDTTEELDKIPPAFVGAVNGEIPGVEHLKGEEIDILDGVTARDNVSDEVTLTITDYDGYNKDVPGVYNVIIEAKDEAGNTTTATKTVTVLDTLERTFDAIKIGDDYTEYVFNDADAFVATDSGSVFREDDKIYIMDKDFFIKEFNEHKNEYPKNGNIPLLVYGAVVITDEDYNIKLVRIAAGLNVEINEQGETKTENLTWNNALDANGGGNLKGIIEEINTLIPDGGYVLFTSSALDISGRNFIIRNLYYTDYQGGAITKDQYDAPAPSTVKIELEENFTEIIAVPDKIATPVISITRHVLEWDAVDNAKEYQIYVDGELKVTTAETSYALANLELEVTPDGEEGYSITVKAITKDMYQWSSSDISDPIIYKQIEILPIDVPVVAVDGTTVTWDNVDGADSYEVYISFGATELPVIKTEETNYDLSEYNDLYPGYIQVIVKAIGDNEHYDSENSDAVFVKLGKVERLTIGGQTVDLIRTPAFNYFTRRNVDYAANKTGFANAPYIYLITDIYSITKDDFEISANEAYGTVVLLDSEGKAKIINNILGGQTWKVGEGWIEDPEYTSNAAQLANIIPNIEEGDMLLIGKNGCKVEITYEDDTTQTVNARDFVAYHYINPWDGYSGTEGWRDYPNFIDPTNVTYTISDKVVENSPVDAPVVTVDGTTVTWDAVDGANSYEVYISFGATELEAMEITETTFDLVEYNDLYPGYVQVIVKAIGDSEHGDSENSNAVFVQLGKVERLTIGGQTVELIRTPAFNYFTRRNVDYATNKTGFANAPYIYLITDIYSITKDDFEISANEAYSTVVLLDSEGKAKIINNILGGQTWKVGEGWINDSSYTSNASQLDNIIANIEEGDMLLIGKNGSKVEITYEDDTTQTVNARDFVAYHYINPWDGYSGTEGWRDYPNFIDPTNVTYTISE